MLNPWFTEEQAAVGGWNSHHNYFSILQEDMVPGGNGSRRSAQM